ncbi:NAD(P)/FAD-dependent oxidoreductase [Denitrobaculum tricleocarpae]|uniref:NAD(P)/FAD-dependent oxidoreductase n=1 Tax=Denitrobaculum tricleocarpae TaxID=2591009 RepID=A0A545SXY9_9PROT|nr:NAD(P)/FAD-dependent oxidoreductase [Denitrobaculum tricleocarpae]TQV69824.1 NAD(P)/FAD-dependent oxidoreductase [Denitrobaculum tricleocarpae]
MRPEYHVQSVVVGSGVIGLAIARKLARAGREVLILEAEDSWGHHTSARNSQVIHAGMYYAPGSLKARFCVEGKKRLYDFCRTRHIDHDRIEKLIVATAPDQVAALKAIHDRGHANGVTDLTLVTAEDAMKCEPELACCAAILSPSTGIIDAPSYMNALLGEAEAAGAFIAYHSPLEDVVVTDKGFELSVGDANNTRMSCDHLINAAGLGGWDVARRTAGFDPTLIPPQCLTKGCYVSLSAGKAPFQRLIYPMPDGASLGVHYIRDIAGRVTFGPDVRVMDGLDLDYSNDGANIAAFERAVRTYWPGLPDDALQPDTCGIRPRITPPGAPLADFMILGPDSHGVTGLVQLFGIESPGLTSSLAIAEYVAELI